VSDLATPPIAQPLIEWYAEFARDLPWRRPDFGSWGVLVSEFMLQQTPVNRVIPHLEAWLERWPTPGALAAEPPAEAVRQWANLGYPRRALRLHRAAVEIGQRHGGVVPSEVEDLLALSGVGEYTARAVAVFARAHRPDADGVDPAGRLGGSSRRQRRDHGVRGDGLHCPRAPLCGVPAFGRVRLASRRLPGHR